MKFVDTAQTLQQRLDKEVLLHRITNRIRQSLELEDILTATVAEIRSFLGTDRVKIYRFDTDGSGEVIAESIYQNRLPSLLGLHFPADDIPLHYRELYLKARVRSIVDISSQQVGLSALENPETGQPIDSTDLRYRPVDGCHVEYLKAMGVYSSIVVPIVNQDQLWGLLVSHHSESQFVFEEDLQVVQQVADQVAIAIAQSTLLTQTRERQQREASVNHIASLMHGQPTIQLQAALEATVAVLDGSGGRLYIQKNGYSLTKVGGASQGDRKSFAPESFELFTFGEQPTVDPPEKYLLEQHPQWQKWLKTGFKSSQTEWMELSQPNGVSPQVSPADLWQVTDLYKESQLKLLTAAFECSQIRGMLVVPLFYRQELLGCLTIFRNEIETEKMWAGQFDPNEKQLFPRLSFGAWREYKKGQARSWTENEIELVQALKSQFSMAIQQYLLYQKVQALNSNLERQVEERTAQLQNSLRLTRVVKQVTDQIRSTLELRNTLQTIVKEVRSLLKTDRVLIYKFRSNQPGEVTVEDVRGKWRSVLGVIGPNECFPENYIELYQQGRVRAINDINLEALTSCHREFLDNLQVKANLIVPIRRGWELWGLLIAHECQGPRTWKPGEIELVQQLADQAAIAIHQAELYEQTRAAATQAIAQAQQLEAALKELTHTQTQLVQSEKMSSLGQLVAGVAHEINNPVNFIYGNLMHASEYTEDLLNLLELYQQHYPNGTPDIAEQINAIDLDFLVTDLPKMLASMKVGADRIRQLVLSLRNFSRLDQSDMKPVDIHEGIDSTLLILQHRLKAKPQHAGIKVIKEYGKLPPVECYAGQLNQVFMNILANAIDALDEYNQQRSPEDAAANPSTIKIHTEVISPAPPTVEGDGQVAIAIPHVLIRISDNGPGIPAAVKARIFEPFFTTKPIGQGTGMGLSISHQIVVEKHGGVFKCFSQPNAGTEFWIEIPLQQQTLSAKSDIAVEN